VLPREDVVLVPQLVSKKKSTSAFQSKKKREKKETGFADKRGRGDQGRKGCGGKSQVRKENLERRLAHQRLNASKPKKVNQEKQVNNLQGGGGWHKEKKTGGQVIPPDVKNLPVGVSQNPQRRPGKKKEKKQATKVIRKGVND